MPPFELHRDVRSKAKPLIKTGKQETFRSGGSRAGGKRLQQPNPCGIRRCPNLHMPRKASGGWSERWGGPLGAPERPLTLEANVEGDAGEGRVDDVAQVHLLLFVEVELAASPAGVAERDELLRVEPVERLEEEEQSRVSEAAPRSPSPRPTPPRAPPRSSASGPGRRRPWSAAAACPSA